jgi:hypothetical protein
MWVNFRCKFLAEVGQFCARINRRPFHENTVYLYSIVTQNPKQ